MLSRHIARGEMAEATGKVAEALKGIFALTLPATVGIILLARPVVELIYERGAFGGADSEQTARVLLLYALGLWAYSGQHVLVRAFYSLKDTTTPVRVATIMVALNLGLNLALVGPFQEAGLAFATAISGILQFGFLLLLLRRRLPDFRWRLVSPSFLRSLALSALMGVALWAAVTSLLPAGPTTPARITRVTLGVVLGMAVYAGAGAILRTPEFGVIQKAIRVRFGRREGR
jgi:putative peptidoglycan lipid II flippase